MHEREKLVIGGLLRGVTGENLHGRIYVGDSAFQVERKDDVRGVVEYETDSFGSYQTLFSSNEVQTTCGIDNGNEGKRSNKRRYTFLAYRHGGFTRRYRRLADGHVDQSRGCRARYISQARPSVV